EAMACGLPVVASAVPGNNTLVHSGETGFLFPLGDGDALCAALQQIRDQPDLARALGESGRRRVEQDFSWEYVARCYLDLFNSEN
ncbi:MAG: glycosyltransferase family 4 protein, partial [Proteobacteria bacterium]|nr:glycosyltransferase family 4 protein [Pseudomonadota bacterium]